MRGKHSWFERHPRVWLEDSRAGKKKKTATLERSERRIADGDRWLRGGWMKGCMRSSLWSKDTDRRGKLPHNWVRCLINQRWNEWKTNADREGMKEEWQSRGKRAASSVCSRVAFLSKRCQAEVCLLGNSLRGLLSRRHRKMWDEIRQKAARRRGIERERDRERKREREREEI